jgi:hypothetical protein
MRFLPNVHIPTEARNNMVHDPNLLEKLKIIINAVNAKAAYFGPTRGDISIFFGNIDNENIIPAISDLLFQEFKAKIEVT